MQAAITNIRVVCDSRGVSQLFGDVHLRGQAKPLDVSLRHWMARDDHVGCPWFDSLPWIHSVQDDPWEHTPIPICQRWLRQHAAVPGEAPRTLQQSAVHAAAVEALGFPGTTPLVAEQCMAVQSILAVVHTPLRHTRIAGHADWVWVYENELRVAQLCLVSFLPAVTTMETRGRVRKLLKMPASAPARPVRP